MLKPRYPQRQGQHNANVYGVKKHQHHLRSTCEHLHSKCSPMAPSRSVHPDPWCASPPSATSSISVPSVHPVSWPQACIQVLSAWKSINIDFGRNKNINIHISETIINTHISPGKWQPSWEKMRENRNRSIFFSSLFTYFNIPGWKHHSFGIYMSFSNVKNMPCTILYL